MAEVLENKKENIFNIPNFLTLLRVISAFVAVVLLFSGFPISYIVAVFIFGMLTDFFDGQIARRFNMKTEFGRQFDMVADRVLIIGVALAILIKLEISGVLTEKYFFQILFMLSREIITFPIVLVSFWLKLEFPQVRIIGKVTTFMQSVAFPAIILSIFYPFFNFSWYLTVVTGICGLLASICYIYDVLQLMIKKYSKLENFIKIIFKL
jgi:phosphatidylglycerophosphate synthase